MTTAREWTIIKVTIPGRYKRTIPDPVSGAKRAPTADEAAEGGLKKQPDRVAFHLISAAELPAVKARFERHGAEVDDVGGVA
jgi:hypothetical protein